MRMSELTAVAPLTSPEEPPATSYAAVSFSSPAYFSITRAPAVSS